MKTQKEKMQRLKRPYYKFLNPNSPLITTGEFPVGRFPILYKKGKAEFLGCITITAQRHISKRDKNVLQESSDGESLRRANRPLKIRIQMPELPEGVCIELVQPLGTEASQVFVHRMEKNFSPKLL
jgi:hypothetical protein